MFGGSIISTYWGVLSANALTSLVNDGFSTFMYWIKMMCICLVAWVIQIVLSSYLHALAIQNMNIQIRKDIASNLANVDEEYIYDKATSSYVSWMVNDIATINEYGFGNFSMILSQIFNILTGGYVLFSLHYSLIASILLLTVAMVTVPKMFSKKLNAFMLDVSRANENFTHNLNGLFNGLRVLYSTQSMPYFMNKIVLESKLLAKNKIRYSSYSGLMQSATNGVSIASQIVLLMQAGWLYFAGYVVIGSLSATQYLSATIFSSLTGLK
ncbi:ABC transporter transmembrane domain-containing protein [Streptococcus zhangguiae]|uniref:ABC transporter transmembrane domain-containing protein n=1 Tax=Streptococcus zhangguiae TaxID=2664091 RepID=UPI002DD923A1|nr:ABC transporter transmembrane domain-containing protein [Streptococcus sp. zg-86]